MTQPQDDEMACPRCLLTVQVDANGDWTCGHCKLTADDVQKIVDAIVDDYNEKHHERN